MFSKTISSIPKNTHAIVIGGSIAGLLAARVLADHFDRVTIVERDRLPDKPEARSGVPQARHFHQLLARGREIIEQLFPGISADLRAKGASFVDSAGDLLWLTPAGWTPRYDSGLDLLGTSRDLLEWAVRRRVLANAKVEVLQAVDVVDLLTSSENARVIGVRIRPRRRSSSEPIATKVLYADLVVDASGRHSKTPQWLAALGYESPQETVIDARLSYASRFYQIPAGFKNNVKAIYIQAEPPDNPCSGILFQVEGNRWLVSLNGAGSDVPPTDEAGFLNFMRNLRHPILYEILKDTTPLSPISGYQNTANRLRHYEQLTRWPEGFIVIGDAVCAFNPAYGQGMTLAALESLALDNALHAQRRRYPADNLFDFAHTFQKKLITMITPAWTLATSEDYRYLSTEGGKPDHITRFMHGYLDQITLLKCRDAAINSLFLEVLHMLKSPAALFQPWVVGKIIVQKFSHYRQSHSTPGPSQPAYGELFR